MKRSRQRTPLLWGVVLATAVMASPAFAAERELDEGPPPSSASEIESSIKRVFPKITDALPIFFLGSDVPVQNVYRRVHTVDIAPTLSAYLRMKPPSGSRADPLVEVLRGR